MLPYLLHVQCSPRYRIESPFCLSKKCACVLNISMKSVSRVYTEFIVKFSNTRSSSGQAVHNLVNEFETAESILNNKHPRNKIELAKAELDNTGASPIKN